jgi:hypothetical protein
MRMSLETSYARDGVLEKAYCEGEGHAHELGNNDLLDAVHRKKPVLRWPTL